MGQRKHIHFILKKHIYILLSRPPLSQWSIFSYMKKMWMHAIFSPITILQKSIAARIAHYWQFHQFLPYRCKKSLTDINTWERLRFMVYSSSDFPCKKRKVKINDQQLSGFTLTDLKWILTLHGNQFQSWKQKSCK